MDTLFYLGLWKDIYEIYVMLMIFAAGGFIVVCVTIGLSNRIDRMERVMLLRNDISLTYKV